MTKCLPKKPVEAMWLSKFEADRAAATEPNSVDACAAGSFSSLIATATSPAPLSAKEAEDRLPCNRLDSDDRRGAL